MTKINKLLMHGFKSFAKRTELVFGDDFNCVLGPNGAGKCLKGDALVQLADGSLIRIDKLINDKLKTNKNIVLDDGVMAEGDKTKLLSLDTETLKIKQRPVQAYIKRKAPKSLVKIQTRSGRELIATEYHPLFVFKDNSIQSIKAEELVEGQRIAVPRLINIKNEQKENYFFELIDLIEEKDSMYVPFDEKFVDILKKIKDTQWKKLANKIGIPHNSINGLLNRQAINFAHLVKILRFAKKNDKEICSLVPFCKAKAGNKIYRIPWKNSPEFSRLLGYLLAEGRLATTANQIWFTNGCEEIVQDYKSIMDTLFGVSATINEYKPNCWDVLVYSVPINRILAKFGMSGKTGDKEITNLFLNNSTNEEVANLLNGLYSGDGYVSKHSIEIVTKSKRLALGIETLLSRIGITFNSSFIIKVATNTGFSGIYKKIAVYGKNNFFNFSSKIKLVHKEKQEKLSSLLDVKSNPNIDVIEANALIKEVVKDLDIKVKPNKKAFPKLDAYCYNQCLPTREGIKHLLNELFLPSCSGKATQSLLKIQSLCESDIFWDEIISVEQIESKESWVYDLCVEKDHNFIANNFIVHNSNILDALCFVLGKTSAKALRSEKSANLIYNGGKSKKPAKQAEVSIHFDNASKVFPTEDKEVKITRIVRAKGQSVYKINDQVRTRQQILELMSLAKIDPDGYNIILQGDIVRFVEMAPEDRRQLIEEISGISVYEDKKQKAINELNKVDERLKEADIVLAEREVHLKELGKEKEQAERFKDYSDRIKINTASCLHRQIERKSSEKKELEQRIGKNKKVFEKKIAEIRSLKEGIAKLKSEIDKINKEIETRGEKEQVDIHKQVEQLKVEVATSKNRIESINSELVKIKQRKQQLKQNLDEVEEKIKSLEKEQSELEQQIETRKKEEESINKKIEDFKKKNQLDNLGQIEQDIDSVDKEAEEKQKEIQELRQKQQESLRQKDKLELQIQNVDEKIEKVLAVEEENKEQIQELKEKKQEFKKATLELNKLLNEDSSLSAQLANARKNLLSTNEQLSLLKARNLGVQEKIAGDTALKKILEQKNSIKGIYGTVSELGQVNTKYSLALETAAGNKIKSVVVEDDATAAQCIKYLKENKLGIATFLPLNKIKAVATDSKAAELSRANGAHGFAINLVTFEPRFKKVFSYVFGNTIVVDDINTARRLGIGQAKMVTLDGDLAELSGAMKGGYREKTKQRFGFQEKEISHDIKEKEEKAKDLQSVISRLEKEKEAGEQRIVQLRELKASLEGDIIKIEKSLNLESGDIDASKKEKQQLQQSLKQVEKEIDDVQTAISVCNKDLAENRIKRQELKAKINELRSPTLLAELAAFEDKKRELRESGVKLEAEAKNTSAQIETILIPEKENILKIMKSHDKEEENFKNETKQVQEKIKTIENSLKEKERKEKDFYNQFKGLFTKRSKLDDEVKKKESKIESLSEHERKAELRANEVSLALAKVKAELAGFEQEFKQYEGLKLDSTKSEQQLKAEITRLENTIESLGSINMKALEIYDSIRKEYNNLLEKKEKLKLEKEDVLVMMNEIELKKGELFMKTFDVVNDHFKNFFSMLSSKGEASLVLENQDSPFEGGVLIKVKLTGNKFMDIRSLSGGEKSLTALAFIFSIQEHEPASFYVLDEIDAALDKKNSEKLAELVRKYSKKAQYIIISHNDAVIAEADNLYGVSMNEHGISNVVSLKI